LLDLVIDDIAPSLKIVSIIANPDG
jgi:hypothetical protein